jgi:hypothetical protein
MIGNKNRLTLYFKLSVKQLIWVLDDKDHGLLKTWIPYFQINYISTNKEIVIYKISEKKKNTILH